MIPDGGSAFELDTPVLLVDRDRLEADVRRFADEASQGNASLRPHIKTHKTLEIAALQLRTGASGLTCAKLSEAEVYADAGFIDLFVAFPVVGREKARRAANLARRCKLIVGVESATSIQQLSEAASAAGAVIGVRLEIDSGLQRTGVAAEAAEALCRQILAAPGLRLDGIFTFRGISFPGAPSRESDVLGQQEGEWMVAQAERLRGAGIPIDAVSVGSTFTAGPAGRVPGVTEVRPGTYVFFDRMTARAGENTLDEIALSVLATVVSRPSPDIAIIDAGSKTFCGDVVPKSVGLEGYGVTVDGRSGIVERMYEEHGFVRLADGFDPAIGDQLTFYPNHVCTTVNLSDELLIVRQGAVIDRWRVVARGLRL